MEKHFVTFQSPGTFFPETTTKEIAAWDVDLAVAMSHKISERHGAKPYGFRFLTRSRGPEDLDSAVSSKSNFYWLGGTVRTAEEILAGTDPSEDILRRNVRINGFKRIVTNCNSWKFTSDMADDDVILEL